MENCYFNTAANTWGPNLVNPTYNVSAEFAGIVRLGLAIFCLKAIGFLLHAIKPHKKAGGAKGALLSILFLGWFIAFNVYRFRYEGRNCATEYLTGPDTLISPYTEYYQVGLWMWRVLVTLYVFGAVGCLCACVAVCCARKRRM